MQDIMKSLNPPSSDGKKKIVVMDAGISIEDNLKWLRENDYDYITVRRGGSTDDYKIIGDHTDMYGYPGGSRCRGCWYRVHRSVLQTGHKGDDRLGDGALYSYNI